MDGREKDDIRRRVEAWRIAGKVLDEERRARLRAMTDDECRSIIAKIFSLPLPPHRERPTGLIELGWRCARAYEVDSPSPLGEGWGEGRELVRPNERVPPRWLKVPIADEWLVVREIVG